MVRSTANIRGYTNKSSVAQGGRLRFYLSNMDGEKIPAVPVVISRLGLRETPVLATSADVPSQPLPAQPWMSQHWASILEVEIGLDWTSGVYAARLGEEPDVLTDIYFIVRRRQGGEAARMVVQIPTNTINAYNNWGGKSLYNYNSGEQKAARIVSFDRPQQADPRWGRGYGYYAEWTLRMRAFVHWLEAAGYAADYVANSDLHEDPDLLSDHDLLISIGHDEYWTMEMRENLDRFVAAGGNVAVFGGNTCLWQVRLESADEEGGQLRRLVCYRDADADPIRDPQKKTVTWQDVGLPENTSFGGGFHSGAWRGAASDGEFRVCRADHWVFVGTDVRDGDTFGGGKSEPLLTYETNGVDWRPGADGRPEPTGADGAPDTYQILAKADLPHWEKPGNAAMGIFSRPGGGTVFNGATTEWASGLAPCLAGGDLHGTTTAKITRNVIEQLTGMRSRKRT